MKTKTLFQIAVVLALMVALFPARVSADTGEELLVASAPKQIVINFQTPCRMYGEGQALLGGGVGMEVVAGHPPGTESQSPLR